MCGIILTDRRGLDDSPSSVGGDKGDLGGGGVGIETRLKSWMTRFLLPLYRLEQWRYLYIDMSTDALADPFIASGL